ncbi:MAG: tetratricopeptide repeat protein [Treponema sp.]|nr:tetratricopeptide repeat protein [Treponema sp.]
MKLFSLTAAAVLTVISLSGCTTVSSLPVPGEEAVRESNICREYYSIASSYEELKNYSKAVTYYKLSMSDPELHNAAYYKLGRCYVMSKDYSSALVIYEALLKKDPENITLKSSTAYVHAMNSDFPEAERLYKSLYEENPQSEDIAVNYINVLLIQEKYEQALPVFESFKEIFPDNDNVKTFQTKFDSVLTIAEPLSDQDVLPAEIPEGQPAEKSEKE